VGLMSPLKSIELRKDKASIFFPWTPGECWVGGPLPPTVQIKKYSSRQLSLGSIAPCPWFEDKEMLSACKNKLKTSSVFLFSINYLPSTYSTQRIS
jgi:hypothetical protein